jgi:hypothetical protein
VIACEKRRQTTLGVKLLKTNSDNYGPAYELLREIMFANPKQNTK